LAFADGAVLFASAECLSLVTLYADYVLPGGHVRLREKLYLTGGIPARVTWTGSL